MIDVRRLQILRELSAAGSFSAAGRRLGYTQSAISQHVAALERETGLQLVERGTRPVALTDAGSTLLATAEPIFGYLERADAAVMQLTGVRVNRLRLAGFPSACATLLPPTIASLRGTHPGTEIGLIEAEPNEAARALKAGELDLAVGYRYPALAEPPERALEETTLLEERFRLALPSRHRLGGKRPLAFARLADEAWVVPPATGPSGDYRRMLTHACRAAGFEPKIAFEIEDIRAGQALVAAGLGVALVPPLALEPALPGVESRPLADGPVRRITAIRLAGPEPVQVAAAMLSALTEAAGRLRERIG